MTHQDGGSDYGLSQIKDTPEVTAPALAYLPRLPATYRPKIGLVGCGGISEHHLRAYRSLGLEVVALCDLDVTRAKARQKEFYPKAQVYTDSRRVVDRKDIEVIDAATHPEERVTILEAAIHSGKHVLSQKPFVIDLAQGQRLVELAEEAGVVLAVNQNGRWAPHFSYIRQAISSGLLGKVSSVVFSLHWDHTWVAGTPFDEIHHLVLHDFGIHWFDIAAVFFAGREPLQVSATVTKLSEQRTKPPMLAHVLVDYPDGQVTMSFDAQVSLGQTDTTIVCGERGTICSTGPSLREQHVALFTEEGHSTPRLRGHWFENGFQGTMAELLSAVEEGRQPINSARDNLRSLSLCFAALASADDGGRPKRPGEVTAIDIQQGNT